MPTRTEIHPRAQSFMTARDRAEKRGDWNMVRCMNVELARMGYVDPATVAEPVSNGNGSVAVEEPKRKGGRPKLPRCEHGQIADRCQECADLELSGEPDELGEDTRESDPEPFSDPSAVSDGDSVTDDAGEPTEPYGEPVI